MQSSGVQVSPRLQRVRGALSLPQSLWLSCSQAVAIIVGYVEEGFLFPLFETFVRMDFAPYQTR